MIRFIFLLCVGLAGFGPAMLPAATSGPHAYRPGPPLFSTPADPDSTRHPMRLWAFVPHWGQFQFAGNIGFLSAGAGYTFWRQRLQASLLYGYLPRSVGGARVHTFSLKANVAIWKLRLQNSVLQPYLGGTFSWDTGLNGWTRLPDHFPGGYYPTTAFHGTAYGGLRWFPMAGGRADFGATPSLYVESGLLTSSLWYLIDSRVARRSLPALFSLAVGASVPLFPARRAALSR